METTTTTVKKTLGRLKIKMQKIENKNHLQVTFTKRRQGIFRKASELAILCGVEVGIIVQSPADKVYTFEETKLGLESLINCVSNSPSQGPQITRRFDDGGRRRKCEEAMETLVAEREALEAEKEALEAEKEWWDAPIEDMNLHQLEEFLASLEFLRGNVERQITMI